jgi:hypothetical protein
MNLQKTGILLVTALTLSGCARKIDECAYFPKEYPRNNIPVSKMKQIKPNLPHIEIALATIQRCYASHAYMGFDNSLKVWKIVKDEHNMYFVVAELEGVSDLIIIFKVDQGGNIIASYQDSMQ